MLSEPWAFIKAVIHFWAEVSTGGPLVMAIGLAAIFKDKDFKKSTLKVIAVFFLFMGFFGAWEDQKQGRQIAESDRDDYKRKAEYNQKRINTLNDDPKNNPSLLSGGLKIDNSPNSGNIANLQNSPGASIKQTIDLSPRPSLHSTRLLSINVPVESGGYKTEFLLTFANPRTNMAIKFRYPSAVVTNPTYTPGGGGLMFHGPQTFPYALCNVAFLTSRPIRESDFFFEMDNPSP